MKFIVLIRLTFEFGDWFAHMVRTNETAYMVVSTYISGLHTFKWKE